MSDNTIDRIAATLVELHRVCPAMRFGQLVLTIAESVRGSQIDSTYEVTDDEFLAAAQRLLERRRADVAGSIKVEQKRAS